MGEHLPSDLTPSYEEASRSTTYHPVQEYYAPMQSIRTLQLLHVSRKVQTCSFPPGANNFHYSIKVHDSQTLIKKPDLIIGRESNGLIDKVGEGKFEKYGAGTTIEYSESKEIHDLQLESSLSQRFMITVGGIPLWWWQPSRRNKEIAELVTDRNELVAQFTYSGEHTLLGRDVKDDTVLGVLEVDGHYASQRNLLDQLVCTTVVLVERGRRRGRNLRGAEGTSPMFGLASGGNMLAGGMA